MSPTNVGCQSAGIHGVMGGMHEVRLRGFRLGWIAVGILWMSVMAWGAGTNTTTGTRRTVVCDGDPINLAVAEFTVLEKLVGLGGPMPLDLRLYYGSARNTRRLPDGLPFKFAHDRQAFLIHDTAANTIALEQGPAVETGFVNVNGGWRVGGAERSRLQLHESGIYYYLCDPVRELVQIYRRFQTNRNEIAAVLEVEMDRNGNRLLYRHTHPALRGPDAVSDEYGRELRFDYRFPGTTDTNTYLNSITDHGGRTWRFLYEENSADAPATLVLRSLVQPDGGATTFRYFTNGNHFLHSLTLPRGNTPARHFYRSNSLEDLFTGKVVRQIDALGNEWKLGIHLLEPFEHPVSRISLEQPDGTQRSMVHDHGGTMLRRFTDEDAQSISYELDPVRDRFSAIVDRRGHTNSLEYHEPSGKIASWVNARGLRHRFHYVERRVLLTNPMEPETFPCTFFDLVRVDYPDGAFELLERDERGNVVSRRNAAGEVTRFGYNSRGQVIARTNALGGVTRYDYDGRANLVAESDSDGVGRTFGYDALFRRTSVTNADGTVVRYGFDPMDRLTSVVDERGVRLELQYDANGSLSRVVRGAGTSLEQVETLGYDAMDRLVRWVDAAGVATEFAHTFRGGLKRARFADGVNVELGYDRRHFVTELVDEAGHRLRARRDGEGLPVEVASPAGRRARAEYDPEGFPIEAYDARTNRFVLAWDARQRLTNVVDRLGRGVSIERDGEGRILRLQLPVVGAVNYVRNALGLITNLTDFRSGVWQLDYTAMGRLRAVFDPLGRGWQFAYDNRGRLQRIVQPDGITETLVYDPSGNLSRRDFSDGLSLGFTHDVLGRVTATASVPVGRDYDVRNQVVTQSMHGARFRATYDARQRLEALDYDGLTRLTYTYDVRGLVRRVTDGRTGAFVELEYDADRLLVGIRRSNGVTTDLERDANGQLTRIRHGGKADLRYTRNAGDEIVGLLGEGMLDVGAFLAKQSMNFSYDAANQLNAAGFENDLRGRRRRDPQRSYGWDAADRLVALTNGATVLRQEFTASGDVAVETLDGVATQYFYQDAISGRPMLAERRAGAYRRYYVFTPEGMLLFSVELPANTPGFYHFDHAGTTLLLTDAQGEVTDRYGYTPYGRLVRHEGASDQPYTHNGQVGVRRVGNTGIYHMGARFYDSVTGRFLLRDPAWASLLERPTELNPYGFARQNPVSFADPTGRESFFIQQNGVQLMDPAHTARPGEVVGEVDDQGMVSWKIAVLDAPGPNGRRRVKFEPHDAKAPFKCSDLDPDVLKSPVPAVDGATREFAMAPGADLEQMSIVGSTISRRMQALDSFRPPRITFDPNEPEPISNIDTCVSGQCGNTCAGRPRPRANSLLPTSAVGVRVPALLLLLGVWRVVRWKMSPGRRGPGSSEVP